MKNEIKIDTNEINNSIQRYETAKIIVKDTASKLQAQSVIKELTKIANNIKAFFKEPKNKAYDTWKTLCNQEKQYLDKVESLRKQIQDEVLRYEQEEQARLEKERARLQAEAEARAQAEREALLKKAEQAKREETKQAYLAQAQAVQPVIVDVKVESQNADGISYREVWKARVVEVNLLPREYMIPNEKLLDNIAKSTKGSLKIPGVEFYSEKVMAVRTK